MSLFVEITTERVNLLFDATTDANELKYCFTFALTAFAFLSISKMFEYS